MPRYARINSSLWLSSKKWRRVQDDAARLLYFYLHTCPHARGTGCYVLPLPYAMADLGWPEDKVLTALTALSDCGLIAWDAIEQVVYCTGAARQDPPKNPSQATGRISDLDSIPDCLPKLQCQQELVAVLSEHPKLSIACREGIERVSGLCGDSLYTVSTQSEDSVHTVLAQCGHSSGSGSGSGSGSEAGTTEDEVEKKEDTPEEPIGNRVAVLWSRLRLPVPKAYDHLQARARLSSLTAYFTDDQILAGPQRIAENPDDLAWVAAKGYGYLAARTKNGVLVLQSVLDWKIGGNGKADDLSGLEALRRETADR